MEKIINHIIGKYKNQKNFIEVVRMLKTDEQKQKIAIRANQIFYASEKQEFVDFICFMYELSQQNSQADEILNFLNTLHKNTITIIIDLVEDPSILTVDFIKAILKLNFFNKPYAFSKKGQPLLYGRIYDELKFFYDLYMDGFTLQQIELLINFISKYNYHAKTKADVSEILNFAIEGFKKGINFDMINIVLSRDSSHNNFLEPNKIKQIIKFIMENNNKLSIDDIKLMANSEHTNSLTKYIYENIDEKEKITKTKNFIEKKQYHLRKPLQDKIPFTAIQNMVDNYSDQTIDEFIQNAFLGTKYIGYEQIQYLSKIKTDEKSFSEFIKKLYTSKNKPNYSQEITMFAFISFLKNKEFADLLSKIQNNENYQLQIFEKIKKIKETN